MSRRFPNAKPRRPILSKSVVASLDTLTKTTPATDETEAGLRYLRALVGYECRPETVEKRAAMSRNVQAIKRRTRTIGTRRGRPPKAEAAS